MNVLVVNDDGIDAQGIRTLANHLKSLGNIYVIAPDVQRSGASHSISMRDKLKFIKKEIDGVETAFSLSGSPADCVKMGLELLKHYGINIDLVVSGINHGANVGEDVIYSGTVGAAREALLNGVMSIAVSVDNDDAKDFEYAGKITEKIARKIEKEWIEKPEFLININVPDIPVEKIKGFKVTRLGIRKYADWFSPVELGAQKGEVIEVFYGGSQVVLSGIEYHNIKNDVEAVDNGFVAITPIFTDTTHFEEFESIENIIGKMGL